MDEREQWSKELKHRRKERKQWSKKRKRCNKKHKQRAEKHQQWDKELETSSTTPHQHFWKTKS